MCGSASYVFATQSLLTSMVGLSAASAAPLAAAAAWVLKDGFGALGVLLTAGYFSSWFDRDTKRAKLRSDVVHNAGVGIELLTSIVPGAWLLFASAGNVLKGVAGMTGGATKAAIHLQFAGHRGSVGDITAKAQAQGVFWYDLCRFLHALCVRALTLLFLGDFTTTVTLQEWGWGCRWLHFLA
jgi:Vitamin B6 photo-protection and homoeostasis